MREFVDILADRIENDPNLTVAGLASAAGLDNSTIRQMIKHRRNPRIDTAMKICAALNTTVEGFFHQDMDPNRAELQFLLDQLEEGELRLLLAAAKGFSA